MTYHSVDVENCGNCGRESRPHCPECGSYRVYAYASKQDKVTRPDGKIMTLRVFRCSRCANIFNDDAWMFNCRALPQRLGRPADASRATSGKPTYEELPDELKGALSELDKIRAKRGE